MTDRPLLHLNRHDLAVLANSGDEAALAEWQARETGEWHAEPANATEAIAQGIYGGYLADRARELEAEFHRIVRPGEGCSLMELAAWAGRASVTLGLIADEFGDLPGPALGHVCPQCPGCDADEHTCPGCGRRSGHV